MSDFFLGNFLINNLEKKNIYITVEKIIDQNSKKEKNLGLVIKIFLIHLKKTLKDLHFMEIKKV